MLKKAPCSRCGGPTSYAGEIGALGSRAGSKFDRCDTCGHIMWTMIEPKRRAPQQQEHGGFHFNRGNSDQHESG